MKTLIFEDKSNKFSGFLEYFVLNGAIEINYNIKGEISQNIFLKIYALSSKKPFNKPIIADTLEFKANVASGKCRISNSSLLQNGFKESDIDTFAIAKSDFSENPVVAACFTTTKWDIGGAFKGIEVCEVKNPAQRGKEILNSIKEKIKTNDPNFQKEWLSELLNAVEEMKKSDESPLSDYSWYILDSMKPPLPLSAYRHLLFVTEVMTEFEKCGHYLFGIKKDGHTALALKAERFNPFVNANDCAVKADDYFIVGVYLAPEGQYFEKIEI